MTKYNPKLRVQTDNQSDDDDKSGDDCEEDVDLNTKSLIKRKHYLCVLTN